MGTFIVKEFVKIETELPEYFTESATYFWCLKIIQVLDRDLNINKFENHLAASTSVYYEFIKTDMGIDHTLDDTLALLEGAAGMSYCIARLATIDHTVEPYPPPLFLGLAKSWLYFITTVFEITYKLEKAHLGLKNISGIEGLELN